MKDHIEKYDFSAAISPIEEIVEEAGLLHLYQPVLHELDAV